jgi:Zn finger protein HypA/HybF involved in hydrogenase expression
MIKFTSKGGTIKGGIKLSTPMRSYIECCNCGHQWIIDGDVHVTDCPGCKAKEPAVNLEMGSGAPPDWWRGD